MQQESRIELTGQHVLQHRQLPSLAAALQPLMPTKSASHRFWCSRACLDVPAVLVLGDLARGVPGDAGDPPLARQGQAPLQLHLHDVDARGMVHHVWADHWPAQHNSASMM